MTGFAVTAGVGFVVAALFAGVFVLFSGFAQSLESLSVLRRKALLEADPARFGTLLAPEHVRISRIAVRLTAQGAVLGGLLCLGSALAALGVGEPWLLSAVVILLGWIVAESLVIRWVARRGGDALLAGFSWLIPLVDFLSAPLTPLLSRLVEVEDDAPEGSAPDPAKEEATKDAEVRALLDVAREEGLLEKHEEELVTRAVDFNDRTVGQVMTPRPDIVYAQADAPLDEIADLFVKTKFTRLPLVEGSIDKPVGIVHVKDVFTVLRRPDPPATARPLAREVFFAPESQTVATLLADFRRRRHPLAIVVDEYGAVTGLATLEDLVEELVGEIADEHEDEAPPVVAAGDGSWSVAGRVRVSEIATLFDVVFPPAEYDTVAGLVSEKLGRIPKSGEVAHEAGLSFTVEEADRRRIRRLRVRREAPPARDDGGAGTE
ncbi:MAG TPA: hemolysin family protein [Thermoanaerobaculia bacterium]|nr:hemolysin family protein [Thermoanaerobaculia bacterium]